TGWPPLGVVGRRRAGARVVGDLWAGPTSRWPRPSGSPEPPRSPTSRWPRSSGSPGGAEVEGAPDRFGVGPFAADDRPSAPAPIPPPVSAVADPCPCRCPLGRSRRRAAHDRTLEMATLSTPRG